MSNPLIGSVSGSAGFGLTAKLIAIMRCGLEVSASYHPLGGDPGFFCYGLNNAELFIAAAIGSVIAFGVTFWTEIARFVYENLGGDT
jgi:hypothetical protein